MHRLSVATLLMVLAGCAQVRARGSWAGDTHAGTLVGAAAIAVELALEGDDPHRAPLCDENDPPHTCPGTTPGPLTPPPPPPPGQ